MITPPYQLLDEELNPTGFSIDLLKAIAQTMGLNIKIELGQWNQVKTELEQGKIDGLAAMSLSPERSKVVNFSTSYVLITHSIFIRKISNIKSVEDIYDKQIIVVKGDIMHDYLISNQIYEKWFSVYEKTDIKTQVFRIITLILVPFLVLLFIILFWSWSLRKQVALKTY